MTMPIVRNVTPEFKNEVRNNQHIITLSGAVASSSFLDDTINAKFIKESLDNVNKDILVRLNSGGGDVFEGIEIYNYLKSLDNHVTIEITSLAASAASLIAMAGDKIVVRTGANMMIHEASTIAFGNKSEIQKTLNALETVDTSIIDIYEERTGLDRDDLINYIKNETWLTANQAIKLGFADEKSSKQAVKDDKGGVNNMDNKKFVAMLKQQQKMINAMLNEEDDDDDNQPSQKSTDERLADLENDMKNVKKRLDKLEDDDSNDDDDDGGSSTNEPPTQNKFKRFAF